MIFLVSLNHFLSPMIDTRNLLLNIDGLVNVGKWVPKRVESVFFIKTNIMILDENLLHSQKDRHERLWVLVRLNNIKVAIGVAYFPNDGIDKTKTDELFFELLDNTTFFQSLGYEVILMGDFNGRCVSKCPFSDKNIPFDFQSYNGNRLRQFFEASELSLVNTMACCNGLFTRIMNDQRSTIDYMILSENLANQVVSALIGDIFVVIMGFSQLN